MTNLVRTSKKEPIELAWDEFILTMVDRKYGPTDAFKFAWKASKPWVGLTEEERENLGLAYMQTGQSAHSFILSIEAGLKVKND